MKFKGKNGVIVWLTLLLVLGFAVWFWTLRAEFESAAAFWALMVIFAAIAALIVSFLARNHITVTDTHITAALGPTRAVVEIASIVSMKKVTSLLASSAASSQRVEILYRRRGAPHLLYVSPQDRDAFIAAVLTKNPNIQIY